MSQSWVTTEPPLGTLISFPVLVSTQNPPPLWLSLEAAISSSRQGSVLIHGHHDWGHNHVRTKIVAGVVSVHVVGVAVVLAVAVQGPISEIPVSKASLAAL